MPDQDPWDLLGFNTCSGRSSCSIRTFNFLSWVSLYWTGVSWFIRIASHSGILKELFGMLINWLILALIYLLWYTLVTLRFVMDWKKINKLKMHRISTWDCLIRLGWKKNQVKSKRRNMQENFATWLSCLFCSLLFIFVFIEVRNWFPEQPKFQLEPIRGRSAQKPWESGLVYKEILSTSD